MDSQMVNPGEEPSTSGKSPIIRACLSAGTASRASESLHPRPPGEDSPRSGCRPGTSTLPVSATRR